MFTRKAVAMIFSLVAVLFVYVDVLVETLILTDNILTGSFPIELYTLQKLCTSTNLYSRPSFSYLKRRQFIIFINFFPDTLRISNTSISSSLSPAIGHLTDMSKSDLGA